MCKFIHKHKLLPSHKSYEEILKEIEFGYRVGKNIQNRPKQMLAKFFSRSVRDTVMRNSKDKKKKQEINPVYCQDDLTSRDLITKAEARPYMKRAHEEGWEPRFQDGQLKVKDNGGQQREVSQNSILKYNKSIKPTDKPESTNQEKNTAEREEDDHGTEVGKEKQSIADREKVVEKQSHKTPRYKKKVNTNTRRTRIRELETSSEDEGRTRPVGRRWNSAVQKNNKEAARKKKTGNKKQCYNSSSSDDDAIHVITEDVATKHKLA